VTVGQVGKPARGEVFLGSIAVTSGALTRTQLRGPDWRRVIHGVYTGGTVPLDHLVSCRAALLVAPGEAAVGGTSAAWIFGAKAGRRDADPVRLVVPIGLSVPHRRGVVVHRFDVSACDVAEFCGLRMTTPLRTAWDIAAIERLDNAVVALDDMLNKGIIDWQLLAGYAADRVRCWGAARARLAISLADGRAESPPESRVRLALVSAELRPRPQWTITDGSGTFVARVDLGFPAERVAVEYDGGYHAEPGQLAKDRDRLNKIQEAGWTVVFVTAADLRDLTSVVDRVRGALHRRRESSKRLGPATSRA